MIESTSQASDEAAGNNFILDRCDDEMFTALEDHHDTYPDTDAQLRYGQPDGTNNPSTACRDPESSCEDSGSGSVAWEGSKYTVSDTQFGTYETQSDSGSSQGSDESDPFAIFGGYAQYELFHLLATSNMSKASLSKYLELEIWVRIRLSGYSLQGARNWM